MGEHWQHQLRLYLDDGLAEVARTDRNAAALQPLTDILGRHGATLVSQLDAFEDYVAEAEMAGPQDFPLYSWTKATIADPAKRAKHARAFAVRVAGAEVYAKEVADALEADLQPLVGGKLVARLSKHDTNPANNLPVPPEHRS